MFHREGVNIYYSRASSECFLCPDLLFPVEDADNHKDEDAHADQRDGRQQDAVARSEVQLSAPSKKRRTGRCHTPLCLLQKLWCTYTCNHFLWFKCFAVGLKAIAK